MPTRLQASFQLRPFDGLLLPKILPSLATSAAALTCNFSATNFFNFSIASSPVRRVDSDTPPTVVMPPDGPLIGYFELPMFILALVRLRILSAEKLRRNRRIGIFLVVLAAVLLPTVDPISLAFETVPLLILFELSIWLAVVMERRWERSYGEAIDVT